MCKDRTQVGTDKVQNQGQSLAATGLLPTAPACGNLCPLLCPPPGHKSWHRIREPCPTPSHGQFPAAQASFSSAGPRALCNVHRTAPQPLVPPTYTHTFAKHLGGGNRAVSESARPCPHGAHTQGCTSRGTWGASRKSRGMRTALRAGTAAQGKRRCCSLGTARRGAEGPATVKARRGAGWVGWGGRRPGGWQQGHRGGWASQPPRRTWLLTSEGDPWEDFEQRRSSTQFSLERHPAGCPKTQPLSKCGLTAAPGNLEK